MYLSLHNISIVLCCCFASTLLLPFISIILATQTYHEDGPASWNETLVFDINNPRDLDYKTIDVSVYSDRQGTRGHHLNFLGRVKISGASVPSSESGSSVQHYPLDKRGLFSNVKGEIALKLYAVHGGVPQEPVVQQHAVPSSVAAENEGTGRFEEPEFQKTPFEEINTNSFDEEVKVEVKKKKKEKEVRTFHSIGTGAGGPPQSAPPPMREKPLVVETRADFAKAAAPAASVMQMQMPRQNPDHMLVETRPPVAARLRYRAGPSLGQGNKGDGPGPRFV
ncbi:hypothetical protein V6N12_070172 [Hibiscus sabdariffa]|uniref:C2 domain-containing protein n=1 Tax=Hibiscus sabdariffa TaxID=183260 RepID=A0ABR2FG02_9ROSI